MNKKEFRKELELVLSNAIGEVLTKRNAGAAKEIEKSIHHTSKVLAKKFHKALKPAEKTVKPPVAALKKFAAKTKSVVKSKVAVKSKPVAKKPAAKTKKASKK